MAGVKECVRKKSNVCCIKGPTWHGDAHACHHRFLRPLRPPAPPPGPSLVAASIAPGAPLPVIREAPAPFVAPAEAPSAAFLPARTLCNRFFKASTRSSASCCSRSSLWYASDRDQSVRVKERERTPVADWPEPTFRCAP